LNQQILDIFMPWHSGPHEAFQFNTPKLVLAGLSDASLVEAMVHELWATIVAPLVIKYDPVACDHVMTFAKEMINAWELPEDCDLPDEIVEVFESSRRIAKVIVFLGDPVIREDTMPSLFKDITTVDDMAMKTSSCIPTVFSVVAQAIPENSVLKCMVQNISKGSKFLVDKVAEITSRLRFFGNENLIEPSEVTVATLQDMFCDLPAYQAIAVDGALSEFESLALRVAHKSAKMLIKAQEVDKAKYPSALLPAYVKLYETIVKTTPLDVDGRRVLKELMAVVEAGALDVIPENLLSSIKEYMEHGTEQVAIMNRLKKLDVPNLDTDLLGSIGKLCEHVASKLVSDDLSLKDANSRVAFLVFLCNLVDSKGTRDESRIAQVCNSTTTLSGKLAAVEALIETDVKKAMAPAAQVFIRDFHQTVLKLDNIIKKISDKDKYTIVGLATDMSRGFRKTLVTLFAKITDHLSNTVRMQNDQLSRLVKDSDGAVMWSKRATDDTSFPALQEIAKEAFDGVPLADLNKELKDVQKVFGNEVIDHFQIPIKNSHTGPRHM
jgi:hypothetical protein